MNINPEYREWLLKMCDIVDILSKKAKKNLALRNSNGWTSLACWIKRFQKIGCSPFFFRRFWRFAGRPFWSVLAAFDTLRLANPVSLPEGLLPQTCRWLPPDLHPPSCSATQRSCLSESSRQSTVLGCGTKSNYGRMSRRQQSNWILKFTGKQKGRIYRSEPIPVNPVFLLILFSC